MLDILFWVVTRRFWSGWKQSLIVVTPETVVLRVWANFIFWAPAPWTAQLKPLRSNQATLLATRTEQLARRQLLMQGTHFCQDIPG
jgi:hypothetical protein